VTILPDLLNRIRLIWAYSKFYNDNERVSSILRKISNEIIRRFRAYISISEVLNGDVDFIGSRLIEAINCGIEWKAIYYRTLDAIQRNRVQYGRVWEIDDASIFAQIDAFVQRCRDLIEVCESQMQFVRKSGDTKGASGPIPKFGGTKANEIISAIQGIERSFEQHVDRLRHLDYAVLDVRVSKWHDDYHAFKNAVKDLEVMFTNVVNAAFENNATVAEGVVLVETFYRLAKREAIKRCVDRKAAEMVQLFLRQVKVMNDELEDRRAKLSEFLQRFLRTQEPQYAGSALWAHSLGELVRHSYDSLVRLKHILIARDFDEAKDVFTQFMNVVHDFKQRRYTSWYEDLNEKAKDNGLQQRLDKFLLRRVESDGASRGGLGTEIVCNFDEDLLALFSEVAYWEKFKGDFSIPYLAHDICNKKEQLRVMREHVMLVVRAYNDIIRDINSEEKRLFMDHMRKLDRHIGQGLSKLTWQSKGTSEMYVRDCVTYCQEVHSVVREFKECKSTIDRITKQMGALLLLRVDKNQVYEEGVFESRQQEHREMLRNQYEGLFNRMMTLLKNIYRNFREGSTEVQREWRSQITQIDRQVEQSLKHAVKRSLQELSKAINGDSKTEPQTLFTVQIKLVDMRVTYIPSMVNLTHSVNIVAKEIISVITAVPRIRGQNFDTLSAVAPTEGASAVVTDTAATAAAAVVVPVTTGLEPAIKADDDKFKSFYEIISDDNDILRIVVAVMNGMSMTATELQKYLSYWDKYKALWEMDKDAYIRKYAKSNRSPSQFFTDISRYKNQQAEIHGETSNHSINFVRVDCNEMKNDLVNHCLQCQNKLTALLNQNGATELNEIFELFRKSRENLSIAPINLEELSSKIATCKELKEQTVVIQARFEPVKEMYNYLLKMFEATVKEDEQIKLAGLETAYDEFVSMLFDAEKMLDKCKISMKRELETQVDSYSASMNDIRATSQIELPFSNERKVDEALAMIEVYKKKIAKAREREVALANGLAIFGIPASEHKDLTALAKDVDFLQQIWSVTIEWTGYWDSWKNGQFNDLDVEEMENVAGNYVKKVGKLGRDIKRWKVWEFMKSELDKFRETVPLIQDLRSKAMRPRHWLALQDRVGTDFDPSSPTFTLNEVVKLGLNTHAEFIGELSTNANKELAIEIALADLEKRWADVELDVGTYKDKYYKLRSTDDISQFLEDDSVALSTMKASKFYGSFQTKIDEWEKTLSTISEVVESVLGVQRMWIYLESIFLSGGDIAKQLPQEFTLFVGVNQDFSRVMESFYKFPNAIKSCTVPGLLTTINKMDE